MTELRLRVSWLGRLKSLAQMLYGCCNMEDLGIFITEKSSCEERASFSKEVSRFEYNVLGTQQGPNTKPNTTSLTTENPVQR